MEEVDDEQFDLQFVEAKRKSIIVRSDSSPGFLSRTVVTDGEPIPPKERFLIYFLLLRVKWLSEAKLKMRSEASRQNITIFLF